MNKMFSAILLSVVWVLSSFGQFEDAFTVEASLEGGQVKVAVTVPPEHYLYADHFSVTDALGNDQKSDSLPPTTEIIDPNSGKPKPVFAASFTALYTWQPAADGGAAAIHVKYWGCNDSLCFIPQTKVVELDTSGIIPSAGETAAVSGDWEIELESFDVLNTHSGGLNAEQFLEFIQLDEASGSEETVSGFKLFLTDPVAFVRESGLPLAIIFILLGGLALNLTPCVLPMIPINLAIIGAGAQAGSKGRGFALGATYGV